ncbi:MAG: 50S ribosomal protein L11 methyltransferase [Pseudomonadota bacterium]
MATFTALTTLKGRAKAEALGQAMETLWPEPTGIGVFEIEDGSGFWEVGGYFSDAPDQAGLALLAALHGAADFAVSELPDTDWVAKVRRELAPVEAGRFFVYGGHDKDRLPPDRVGLMIEAAMAFGTGHHGTTRGCLLAFDRLLQDGITPGPVADVGCGTGVLAMAAAKVWRDVSDTPIIASDIDEIAVETATANLAVNGLEGRGRCVVAAGFDHPELRRAAPYKLIFANILKGPLIALAPDVARRSAPGGHVILSGILNAQAEEVCAVYSEHGFSVVRTQSIVDWTTIILGRNLP